LFGAGLARYSQFGSEGSSTRASIAVDEWCESRVWGGVWSEIIFGECTKSGQGLVDGLQVIDFSDSYGSVFFIDRKIKRSKKILVL
jgi:hypothetical protein